MSHQQTFLEENVSTNPLNAFSILRTINSGRNSIHHARDIKTDTEVVLKIYSRYSCLNKGYVREKQNLMNISHPNIVKMIENSDQATSNFHGIEEEVSFLTLEYSPLGDLLEIISKHGQIPEILARTLFHQLIDALSYLHHRNVAHLDLKVENLVLDENLNLKLIDFDFSQTLDNTVIQSNGTPGYRAPEYKTGIINDLRPVDIYAAGVVLFILITGYPPYSEATRGNDMQYDAYYRLFRNNTSRFFEVHGKHKGNTEFYSEDLRSLITQMLAENPNERPKTEEIINSTWFQGQVYDAEEYQNKMKTYLNNNKSA